jgi:CheY-like chemotaxis protein
MATELNRGGTESILVVEDDEAVRETAVSLLRSLGYSVLQAADARSALSIIESGVALDLLFTDVVMPGSMRSPELAAKAKQRMPHLAVLFTSGYTENAIVHAGRLDEGVELLSKPYTHAALARKVREVLAANRSSQAESGEATAETAVSDVRTQPLCILLCEDDASIRSTVTDMLETKGYLVMAAASAEEAVRLHSNEKLDLLVTDQNLPGQSGMELARILRETMPELPAIFTTGRYHADIDQGDPRIRVLTKPYGAETLFETIAQLTSAG